MTLPTRTVGGPTSTANPLEAPPFRLACRYDDPLDPAELTVFSPVTERTADLSTAVPLDRVR